MDIGALIRTRRTEHGISQERLARRCGTSQAFVSRVERGEISPTMDAVQRLLAGLGERLAPSAVERLPGALDDDPGQLRTARATPVDARVSAAFAASAFAVALHGAARR